MEPSGRIRETELASDSTQASKQRSFQPASRAWRGFSFAGGWGIGIVIRTMRRNAGRSRWNAPNSFGRSRFSSQPASARASRWFLTIRGGVVRWECDIERPDGAARRGRDIAQQPGERRGGWRQSTNRPQPLLVLAGCGENRETPAEKPVKPITVFAIEKKDAGVGLACPGKVQASDKVELPSGWADRSLACRRTGACRLLTTRKRFGGGVCVMQSRRASRSRWFVSWRCQVGRLPQATQLASRPTLLRKRPISFSTRRATPLQRSRGTRSTPR